MVRTFYTSHLLHVKFLKFPLVSFDRLYYTLLSVENGFIRQKGDKNEEMGLPGLRVCT
jgi:hypothetical protein